MYKLHKISDYLYIKNVRGFEIISKYVENREKKEIIGVEQFSFLRSIFFQKNMWQSSEN